MGSCCNSRQESAKLEAEISSYVESVQPDGITDELLMKLCESQFPQVLSEQDYERLKIDYNLNFRYKTLCKGEIMLKEELILGLMFLSSSISDERIGILKKIISDDRRKLMHMTEWRYQLVYKNIPEEMVSSNPTDKEMIQSEIDRYRFVTGRSAKNLYDLIHRDQSKYKLLIS